MTNRATAGGRIARFAHLVTGRAKADDSPVTQDDLDEVKDDLEETKDDVEEVKDRVDDVEGDTDDLDDTKKDKDEAEMPPAEAKAYRAGKRAGAAAENKRCAAIFGTPQAAQNLSLTASLAFDTRVSAAEGRALLVAGAAGAQPAPKPQPAQHQSLDRRMAEQAPIRLGADVFEQSRRGPDMDTPEGVAAFILGAGRKPAADSK